MYRVYNAQKKKWVKDGVYLSPNPFSYLHLEKKNIFGKKRLIMATQEYYVIHRDIGLYDKNNVLIYEGDYVKAQVAEDKVVVGMVSYAHELSAYVILCFEVDEFYSIGNQVCEYIEVIGNVFDGRKENGEDSQ